MQQRISSQLQSLAADGLLWLRQAEGLRPYQLLPDTQVTEHAAAMRCHPESVVLPPSGAPCF